MKMKFLLLACFGLFLTSCGCHAKSVVPSSSAISYAQPGPSAALDWLGDDQIYFNLNCSESFFPGLSVKINDVAIAPNQAVSLPKGYTIDIVASAAPQEKFYLYYCAGEDAMSEGQTILKVTGGIDSGVNPDYFTTLLPRRAGLLGAKKRVFLCVSDRINGWDHSLSSDLDDFFENNAYQAA